MSEGKSKAMSLTLTALITAIVVGGAVYFWQKNDSKEYNKESQEIKNTENIKPATTPATATLSLDKITLKDPQSIPGCKNIENASHRIPTIEIQKQLGIGPLLDVGYTMTAICRDTTSHASFILAKNEANLLSQDSSECSNNCDRIAFGSIDFTNKKSIVILSAARLGVYGEAFGQNCAIDSVEAKGLYEDKINFYCGSGESGGFTDWYNYKFNGDILTEVQKLKTLSPEKFDVKNPELLKKFDIKANNQMQ